MTRRTRRRKTWTEVDRRFAREVLPALQAHRVERVPLAEEAAA
jgi:hypothetical protein